MAKVTLKTLVAATRSEAGFMFATEKDVAELVKHGFAEVNQAVQSDDGKKFGVRASESGLASHDAAVAKEAAGEVEEVEFDDGFEILDEPMPANAPKVQRASKYPFDKLNVGQSFKVLDSKVDSGNAFSAMSSAVNNANKRWSTVIPGEFETVTRGKYTGKEVEKRQQERKFEQRRVDGGTQVYRVL